MFKEQINTFKAILDPEPGTGLKYIEGMGTVAEVVHNVLLPGRQRRLYGNVPENGQGNAVNQVIATHFLFFIISIGGIG
jgi:hypothetical protein